MPNMSRHSVKVLHYKVHVDWTVLMLRWLPLLFVQRTLNGTINHNIKYPT